MDKSREILFRGKRIDNGEWVYGSFCMDALEQKNGLCGVDGFIRLYDDTKSKMQMYEVDRETVGQFTGLHAMGERLYEGDIVAYGDEHIVIEWETEWAGFACRSLDGSNWHYEMSDIHWGAAAIVGNICDTPDFMEVDT